MSKITPKNLSYDSTLPPFLARLQAHNTSLNDRHEFSIARPKKPRTAEDEAEDEPVYFNEESGETLTKSEWEAREAGTADSRVAEKEVQDDDGSKVEELKDGKGRKDEKFVGIGAGKKRKAGKIIGGAEENDTPTIEEKKAPKPANKKMEKSKPSKKAKKIKLSFGDDE